MIEFHIRDQESQFVKDAVKEAKRHWNYKTIQDKKGVVWHVVEMENHNDGYKFAPYAALINTSKKIFIDGIKTRLGEAYPFANCIATRMKSKQPDCYCFNAHSSWAFGCSSMKNNDMCTFFHHHMIHGHWKRKYWGLGTLVWEFDKQKIMFLLKSDEEYQFHQKCPFFPTNLIELFVLNLPRQIKANQSDWGYCLSEKEHPKAIHVTKEDGMDLLRLGYDYYAYGMKPNSFKALKKPLLIALKSINAKRNVIKFMKLIAFKNEF